MLIQCPECDLQVSDKANTCPHCGYPLKPDAKPKSSRKPNKRRRLPNGFGQISEIKGRNLRNPFRAMVTVGKDKNGKPICKPLKPESYFPTYNDAYYENLSDSRGIFGSIAVECTGTRDLCTTLIMSSNTFEDLICTDGIASKIDKDIPPRK